VDEVGGPTTKVSVDELDEAQMRELVPTLLQTIAQLQAELADLKRARFGRRSEKGRYLDGTDLLPFSELDELRAETREAEQAAESIEVPAHSRKKTKRRRDFPDHLPRKRTECTLTEAVRACPCCGEIRVEIGEVTSNELERVEFTYVHEIARKKYACRKCEGNVVIAPGIDRVLDKCLLGAKFLAQIIFERFGNHMPYARLEKKYGAEGLSLSRSVMCTSTIRCGELLRPVYEAVREQVLESLERSVLQADDTEVVQRNGPNPGERKVHVWAWRDQHAGVFYEVTDTRNRDGPKTVLGDRRGRLQCDGHDCFSELDPDLITRIGCWAHVRRYFEKARRSGDELANKPLGWIRKLFAIEKQAKQGRDGRPLSDAELLEIRHDHSAPVVAAMRSWLDQAQIEKPSLPGGPLMKGVGYAINQWPTLVRFLGDGRIREISNNGCERALRKLVIGRNNWQWFGSDSGARTAVVLLTLVQSCREHGINPLLYLGDVLREVSTTPASRIHDLTPTGWRRRQRAALQVQRSRDAIAAVVRDLTFTA
jgi:transposase